LYIHSRPMIGILDNLDMTNVERLFLRNNKILACNKMERVIISDQPHIKS